MHECATACPERALMYCERIGATAALLALVADEIVSDATRSNSSNVAAADAMIQAAGQSQGAESPERLSALFDLTGSKWQIVAALSDVLTAISALEKLSGQLTNATDGPNVEVPEEIARLAMEIRDHVEYDLLPVAIGMRGW